MSSEEFMKMLESVPINPEIEKYAQRQRYSYTGIANYITPQHYAYTIPNTSGYLVPSHCIAGQSGCFTTNPATPSGGVYWDSSCGKPEHQQGYSHSIVKEAVLPTGPKKCDCSMLSLMQRGCSCGGC